MIFGTFTLRRTLTKIQKKLQRQVKIIDLGSCKVLDQTVATTRGVGTEGATMPGRHAPSEVESERGAEVVQTDCAFEVTEERCVGSAVEPSDR